jgi:hypothetical protein
MSGNSYEFRLKGKKVKLYNYKPIHKKIKEKPITVRHIEPLSAPEVAKAMFIFDITCGELILNKN